MKLITKLAWLDFRVWCIACAVFDLELERQGLQRRIFPSLNPYYYKIKRMDKDYATL